MKTNENKTRYNEQVKSPHIEATQGNPIGRKESQELAKESEKHQLSLLGVLQKYQAHSHGVFAEDLAELCRLMFAASVSEPV